MLTYTPANSIFDGPISNLLSILYIMIEIFSRALAQGGGGGGGRRRAVMISNLGLLSVVFRVMARQA